MTICGDSGEISDEDNEKTVDKLMSEKLYLFIRTHNIDPDHLYNADHTILLYSKLPIYYIHDQGGRKEIK